MVTVSGRLSMSNCRVGSVKNRRRVLATPLIVRFLLSANKFRVLVDTMKTFRVELMLITNFRLFRLLTCLSALGLIRTRVSPQNVLVVCTLILTLVLMC